MPDMVKKVVLAYSGGLDTSVILRWLQETYRCEVITFTADLGQGEELEPARKKAELLGAAKIFVDDLREEFVRDFVFPMFRANALYEGAYLLGTSIARPLIAKRQIEIAREVGADAVAHGATGKGNDQVRFELGYYALAPDIKVIAPWREWDLTSRTRLLDYADQHQIPIARDKRGEAPFSVDANLLHVSAEGKVLENPWTEPEEFVFSRTVAPEAAPDRPEYVEIAFERGDPVSVDGEQLSPAELLTRLNALGGRHGIGRLDLVENRFVGMKSRGVYETPGGTILLAAHRGIESLTLDRGAAHLKDELMPRYAELIYNGFWFSPERRMLQALIDNSQENVEGVVRLKLYKGSVSVVGRRVAKEPLQPSPRHLRRRRGLRPARRRRLHQTECAAPPPRRPPRSVDAAKSSRRVSDADVETLANHAQGLINVLDRRAVVQIEKPVYLGPLPGETAPQLRLGNAGRAHRSIKLDLGNGEWRQRNHSSIRLARRCWEGQADLAAAKLDGSLRFEARSRDILAAGDPGGKSLFDRVGGASDRILLVFAKGGDFRQVRACDENGAVLVGCEGHTVHKRRFAEAINRDPDPF